MTRTEKSEKKAVQRIFRSKINEVARGQRKLHMMSVIPRALRQIFDWEKIFQLSVAFVK
jgi:hypothetical protein